jgi:hypothetical protein
MMSLLLLYLWNDMAKPEAMKRRLSQWIWLLIILPTIGLAQRRSLAPMDRKVPTDQTSHPLTDFSHFSAFEVKPAFPGFWLHWEVQSEKTVRYYYLERSSDEGRYALSGGVMSSPERNKYNFIDMLPEQGAETFDYRIEVLFEDGSVMYSPTFRVYPNATQQLRLFPNPTQERIVLQSPQHPCEGCSWTLFDETGKVVANGDLTDPLTEINLSRLQTGQYLIVLTSAANRQSWLGRFIKQ